MQVTTKKLNYQLKMILVNVVMTLAVNTCLSNRYPKYRLVFENKLVASVQKIINFIISKPFHNHSKYLIGTLISNGNRTVKI